MAAPAFIASNFAITQVGSQTLTCALPTGLSAGQLILAIYTVTTSTITIDAGPAGWSVPIIDDVIGSAAAKYSVAWTRYTSGMADPFFHLAAASTAKGILSVVVYEAAAADPVFGAATESSAPVSTLSASFTTSVPNTRLVSVFGGRVTSQTGQSFADGQTVRINSWATGAAAAAQLIGDEDVATPGAVTRTGNFTVAQSPFGLLIAIPPTVAASPPVVVGQNATNNGAASTLSVPLSGITGLQTGDLLIATFQYCDAPTSETIASRSAGWTILENDHQMSGQSGQMDTMYAVKTPALADPSWSMTAPAAGQAYNKAMAGVVAIRNAGTPTLGPTVDRTASSTQTILPSLDAAANSLAIAIFGDKVSSQNSVTGPTEMTTHVSQVMTGGGGGSQLVASETRTVAGQTGTRTSTNGLPSSIGHALWVAVPTAGGTTTSTVVAQPGATLSNQEPYEAIALLGAASGGSGTYTTYTWTIESGGGTLTGTGANRTYTPTGTIAGHTVSLGLVVTDSLGNVSTKALKGINVLPVTERAAIGGVLVPIKPLNISTT